MLGAAGTVVEREFDWELVVTLLAEKGEGGNLLVKEGVAEAEEGAAESVALC